MDALTLILLQQRTKQPQNKKDHQQQQNYKRLFFSDLYQQ